MKRVNVVHLAGSKSSHKKASKCPMKRECVLITGDTDRKIIASGTFIPGPRQYQ